jgi:hypothetical protein
MLPQAYPNYKTVHRRFPQSCREETLRKVLTDLANTCAMKARSTSRSASSTRASAKGGGKVIGPT